MHKNPVRVEEEEEELEEEEGAVEKSFEVNEDDEENSEGWAAELFLGGDSGMGVLRFPVGWGRKGKRD